MNNCFTTENSEAKLCYSHKLLFQNEDGLRCSPTNLSLSPQILPVGSWQLSKTFPEKGSPLAWATTLVGWGVGCWVCVSACVTCLGREAITGSKQGLCVVSVCSANRSLSKGMKSHSSPTQGGGSKRSAVSSERKQGRVVLPRWMQKQTCPGAEIVILKESQWKLITWKKCCSICSGEWGAEARGWGGVSSGEAGTVQIYWDKRVRTDPSLADKDALNHSSYLLHVSGTGFIFAKWLVWEFDLWVNLGGTGW